MKLATLCYVRHQGNTLMLHRTKKKDDIHKGKWNGLGGKFETGESPEECARREILEESGLTATGLSLKGLLTFPAFANNEDWYAFVFVVDQFEGELIPSTEGELRWIDDQKLTELELWEGDRYFLPWLNRSGFFSGKFIYQDGNFINYQVEFYD